MSSSSGLVFPFYSSSFWNSLGVVNATGLARGLASDSDWAISYSNSPVTLEQYPHKKDSKSNPANYRPVSLTSLCCKVMEHIILSHIAKHLAANNILIDQQHGFRQRFSCETQLITAINDWAKCINSRSQTDVILLDFSKAFDSVPHQRLQCWFQFRSWDKVTPRYLVKADLAITISFMW